MRYAIFDHGEFVREQDFKERPVLKGKLYRKFYPIERVIPEHDPKTQSLVGPTISDDHNAEVRRYTWYVEAIDQQPTPKLSSEAERERKIAAMDIALTRLAFEARNAINALEVVAFQLWSEAQPGKGTLEEFQELLRRMPGAMTPKQFEDLIRSYLP